VAKNCCFEPTLSDSAGIDLTKGCRKQVVIRCRSKNPLDLHVWI
jgi:hypothetical protein